MQMMMHPMPVMKPDVTARGTSLHTRAPTCLRHMQLWCWYATNASAFCPALLSPSLPPSLTPFPLLSLASLLPDALPKTLAAVTGPCRQLVQLQPLPLFLSLFLSLLPCSALLCPL